MYSLGSGIDSLELVTGMNNRCLKRVPRRSGALHAVLNCSENGKGTLHLDFEEAPEFDPNDADVHFGLADSYEKAGKLDLAPRELEKDKRVLFCPNIVHCGPFNRLR